MGAPPVAQIQFRGKVQQLWIGDSVSYEYIRVPALDRKHCDMSAFRKHPRYGGLANSDLFKGMLARIRKERFKGDQLRLDAIPDGVSVDTSGFLAVVTLEV